MASSNKPPAMLRGSHIAAMKNISQQKREREAPPVERFTSKEDMQVADILLQIKNTDLFLEKDGEDIREMENEVQQNLINEAYFESKLEAARYQDRKEIEYYDDDEIPGVFGDMIEEIAEAEIVE